MGTKAKAKPKSYFERGRSAVKGQFVSLEDARRQKATTVIEKVKKTHRAGKRGS